MKKVLIFDTTLRDGEQSPGATLKTEEKIVIAKQLVKLGVDIIEAGFPVSSPGDFKAVKTIAQQTPKKVTVCALARAVEKDIEIAGQAIKKAKQPRIHTFIGTSDVNLKCQLRKTPSQVLKIIKKMVKKAKSYCSDVEFSPMDASRTQYQYLLKACQTAIKAGATTINIPDTVGYSLPDSFASLIKKLRSKLPKKIIISVHCHNDLGLATANALTAIKAGARQVECTINGLGERAGNTSLEEIVMILKTHQKALGFKTNINTKKIHPTSKLVSKMTGVKPQPNKAVVGRNAFAHASGIHQDGYLKGRQTYEIVKPTDIGLKSSKIVLGARSGRHALRYRLEKLNICVDEEKLQKIYEKFLKIADTKRVISNKDLKKIIEKL